MKKDNEGLKKEKSNIDFSKFSTDDIAKRFLEIPPKPKQKEKKRDKD